MERQKTVLIDELKRRVTAAMKTGNTVEKEILRVALGEIQIADARGTAVTDESVTTVLRKLIKSNEETLAATADEATKKQLAAEIEVLASLLPKSLGVPEIVEALAPIHAAIKAAGNDGQATGVAMKHLKTTAAVVNGKDVTAAVKQIRA
ncbi:MAG: GatB/YqeY domain-containing protein [Byssovorax sp.]